MTAPKTTVLKTLPTDLIDRLLVDYKSPEDLIGEDGLLKQLTKALVERALSAEMTGVSVRPGHFLPRRPAATPPVSSPQSYPWSAHFLLIGLTPRRLTQSYLHRVCNCLMFAEILIPHPKQHPQYHDTPRL